MPRAHVDTTVLFAAGYRRDSANSKAVPILRGIDDGSLPEAVVLDYVLAETLNGLTAHAGHDAAVDFLGRLEKNRRFHVDSLTTEAFATAKDLFRRHRPFSFVDAALVSHMQATDGTYVYAFDDDFEAANGVRRLATATNPYDPGGA